MTRHRTLAELEDGLTDIRQSPADNGVLRAIVIRPAVDERLSLPQVELSPQAGAHGDHWALGCWKSLPDGSPHPNVQIALMNARCIALIAQTEERWPLAGDNLFVDLDLSDANLPCGQQLAIGSALLEITAEPHDGCSKFARRFGPDAVRFINSPLGKQLHLRGVYARIVQPGVVSVGDTIEKRS
ncbi:MOSC domain-containing protein [Lignipirellula cremea]|uniref:MOSC domain-containing protein n=1 Tax=Lignipirellula cremea TaxID=2528010 RepID=A0A518E0F0_9BACT|nr:MOSC domain-containing protein [Lignipirellula cremea]QDU97549.1 hypothetical protein Pla8534_53970 [Lignipirellula cremea]